MENRVFLIVNVILAISCAIMSLFILFVPLPKTEGLKNFGISLRLMALAYFSLFLLTLLNMLLGKSSLNFPIALTTISVQTVLIAFSLIGLMNSHFISRIYILKFLTPTLLFVILILAFNKTGWNHHLPYVYDFIPYYHHPVSILNRVFLLFCVVQLIYLSAVFIVQAKKYKTEPYCYYDETYLLQLPWVRYYFYVALAFCILVIGSLFFPSPTLTLIITTLTIVFYTAFGLFYIQYQHTYRYIAPMKFIVSTIGDPEVETNNRYLSWDKLKGMVIADKFYLRPELDIEQMARYLKIGRSTLSGYINREEKMCFHAWINSLRIEEAQRIMITNPNYTIAEVSDAVGFSEPSNFSREFKHITHQAPLVWKQKQLRKRKKQ